MDLKKIYRELKEVKSNPAVSIFVPTHRTFPDNEADPIQLKNALSETEKRLLEHYEKRLVWDVMGHINQKFENHDHNYNLDTLAIFATPDQAEVYNFPFHVVPRVIFDDNFALRDVIREDLQSQHYYLLTVSWSEANLYEVFNGAVVKTFTGEDKLLDNVSFPIANTLFKEKTSDDQANSIAKENLYREYLNRVDKSMQEIHKSLALPVFVAGDDKAVAFYQQESDNLSIVAGSLTQTENVEWDVRLLIQDLQPVLDEYQLNQEKAAVELIGQTRGQNLLMADLASIYRSAKEGRIDTLFVRKGYVAPAQVDAETLDVVVNLAEGEAPTTDDVVDDLIDAVLNTSGNIAFIRPELFDEGENVLAKLRY